MPEMKVDDVFALNQALIAMRNDRLPLRVASWLVLVRKAFKPTINLVYEKRNEIIKKYCKEGEITVARENDAAYKKEIDPYLEEMITVPAVQKIKRDAFENVAISPASLESLEPMLED